MVIGVGGKNMIDYDLDLWDWVMMVNVKGIWLVICVVVLLLCEGVVIVNVVLDIVLWGVLWLMVYVVSKGVVIVMICFMVCELGEKWICINVIVLGLICVEVMEYVLVECY